MEETVKTITIAPLITEKGRVHLIDMFTDSIKDYEKKIETIDRLLENEADVEYFRNNVQEDERDLFEEGLSALRYKCEESIKNLREGITDLGGEVDDNEG